MFRGDELPFSYTSQKTFRLTRRILHFLKFGEFHPSVPVLFWIKADCCNVYLFL
ncbi:hypothetical protein P8852_09660 [Bacillus spizizenii]|uniref:Uncharacterized protein n=1 Tax=Bacillus spizizenii (strain DSM 15029 / JCM 12233 / NBRC 101239 / NRRL B-23049 / TU-B-10) TaxID=1052585 RepID=G4NSW0_BACS4|nr:hypothetical protein GYO_2470 [Bacillus spizizenii TU-B-10]AHA78116.1 Hypothetical Protein U712_10865 [Bacillus subtilis PY79]MEC0725010.1 hypothetical protein [Bacillus spizizenii]SCV41971.1 hypothetical protein BQ1740_2775 [Bacillus subtilis]